MGPVIPERCGIPAGQAGACEMAPILQRQSRGLLEMDRRGPAQADSGVGEAEVVVSASITGCLGDDL